MQPHGLDADPDPDSQHASVPSVIDLTRLDGYSDDSVKQIILDARIKQSRVSAEITECHKIIDKAQKEIWICFGRIKWYQLITNVLSQYLQERKTCPRKKQTTPPEKNSQP